MCTLLDKKLQNNTACNENIEQSLHTHKYNAMPILSGMNSVRAWNNSNRYVILSLLALTIVFSFVVLVNNVLATNGDSSTAKVIGAGHHKADKRLSLQHYIPPSVVFQYIKAHHMKLH